MFKKYYIFTIGDYQYLLHRKGYDKTSYDKLVLKTYKNDKLQLNILTTKDYRITYFGFGHSDKLVNILEKRGVAHEVRKIIEYDDELSTFKLENNQTLKISERNGEAHTYYTYHFLNNDDGRGYKFHFPFHPKQFLDEPVTFTFEGEADAKGNQPREVKEFFTSHNRQRRNKNLSTIIIFILICLLLSWLLL